MVSSNVLIGLLNNVALLLAMGLIYDTLYKPKHSARNLLYQTASGIVLGIIAVVIMSTPVKWEPGVIFDTRTILLGLTGLYFGLIPTTIAVAIAAAYRIFLGGAGMPAGIATIVTAAAIGLLWRKYRGQRLQDVSLNELYFLGIVVHVVMILCMLLLPQEAMSRFFGKLALPVIVIYPVATALLGSLLSSRQRRINAEENVRLLLDSTAEGIYGIDLEGKCTFCNSACVTILGYNHPNDLLGKNMHQLIHHSHQDGACFSVKECRIFKAFQSGEGSHVDDEVLWRADGTSFIAEYWSYPQIRDGKTIGAVVTFLDITERTKSEEVLRESNERFSTAFNCAPVMMTISLLENGVLLDVNQVFLEVSGFTREEVIGRTPVELGWVSEADRMQVYEQLLQDGSVRGMDLMLHAKSGRTVLCRYWGEIISAGGQRQLLSIALDVTEHRRVEQQLVQAQKMESVGRLAGGVAHDFNNMLSVILGHAELGLIRLDPAHPVTGDLTQISKAAERSADLTRQLLAFASKQTIAPKVLDLNEVIAGMLKMLQRLIGEDIHIVWQPAPELWQVKVDPSQVDQILANLFVNARDAITDIGRITITTENVEVDTEYDKQVDVVPGEYVKLTVSDNGSGMDRGTLAHIFEPFFTTKESGKGTGMGLATVFGAVTQNKGFIGVDSSPDQGTTFSIYLPRHVGEVGQMPVVAAMAPLPNGQETVLLVEDEPTILEIAATMLEGLGYVVLKAGSPEAAISLAGNHSGEIDLLLTDVVMPGMNGRSLAAALLPLYPSMKQLFMSGYTADVIAPRGILEEGVQYIQKPFALAALAAKVREVLDAKNC